MSTIEFFDKAYLDQVKQKATGRAKGKPMLAFETFADSGKQGGRIDWRSLADRKADPKTDDGFEPIEDWKGRAAQALRNAKSNLMKANVANPALVEKYKAIEIWTVAEGQTNPNGDDISGVWLYNPNGTGTVAEPSESEVLA